MQPSLPENEIPSKWMGYSTNFELKTAVNLPVKMKASFLINLPPIVALNGGVILCVEDSFILIYTGGYYAIYRVNDVTELNKQLTLINKHETVEFAIHHFKLLVT